MRIVAIANQKGGCGKTTVAINLAACFAREGQRTLLIDLDPQSHCALGLSVPEEQIQYCIGDLLLRKAGVTLERVVWQISSNYELAPSRIAMYELDEQLAGVADRAQRLSEILSAATQRFDVVVLDTPPNVGVLTANAMHAAHDVVVPVDTGYFALHGLSKQLETIERFNRSNGRQPAVRILPNLYDVRTKLAREILAELRRRHGEKMLDTFINFNTKLKESASFGQPITEYDPASVGARDFARLARELLSLRTPVRSTVPRSVLDRAEQLAAKASALLATTKPLFGTGSARVEELIGQPADASPGRVVETENDELVSVNDSFDIDADHGDEENVRSDVRLNDRETVRSEWNPAANREFTVKDGSSDRSRDAENSADRAIIPATQVNGTSHSDNELSQSDRRSDVPESVSGQIAHAAREEADRDEMVVNADADDLVTLEADESAAACCNSDESRTQCTNEMNTVEAHRTEVHWNGTNGTADSRPESDSIRGIVERTVLQPSDKMPPPRPDAGITSRITISDDIAAGFELDDQPDVESFRPSAIREIAGEPLNVELGAPQDAEIREGRNEWPPRSFTETVERSETDERRLAVERQARVEREEQERIRADRERTERAERARMEQERLERQRAEQVRLETQRQERETAERARVERERIEMDLRQRAERDRLEREAGERLRAERDRNSASQREPIDHNAIARRIEQFYGVNIDGDTVTFVLKAPGARNVRVAGDFNHWTPEHTEMTRDGDVFRLTMQLPRGRHGYRYVVDGRWRNDPFNPVVEENPFGELNNIVEVTV